MKLVKLFSTQSKINMVIDYIQILILVISSISFANCFIVFLTWNIVKSEINYSNEKISILIPARNEESKIIKCISKCLNQSETIEEIIVYDDNSDDNTFSIVKELQFFIEKYKLNNYLFTNLETGFKDGATHQNTYLLSDHAAVSATLVIK